MNEVEQFSFELSGIHIYFLCPCCRDYLMNASSKEERDAWINALCKATPLPCKTLMRKTTALKAALTLSSHATTKDSDELGIAVSDSEEDCQETNLDDILAIADPVEHADRQEVNSHKQEVNTARKPPHANQEVDAGEQECVKDGLTEDNRVCRSSSWVEPQSADDKKYAVVIEISIDVDGSGHSDGSGNVGGIATNLTKTNPCGNNNNSNVTMNPKKGRK